MNKSIKIPKVTFLWSASKFNRWNQCNKCFWLKYIEKVDVIEDRTPYLYGSYIHESIEALERGDKPLDVMDLVIETERPSDIQNAEYHLEQYSELKKKLKLNNGVCELEFLVESDMQNPFKPDQKLFFYGFLDRVEFCNTEEKPQAIILKDNKITCYNAKGEEISNNFSIHKMIEYKTKGSKWGAKAIKDSYQFSMYQYICNKLNKDKGVACNMVNFIRGDNPCIQIEEISRSYQELLDWEISTKQTIDDILKKNINQNSTCGFFSPYKSMCRNYTI